MKFIPRAMLVASALLLTFFSPAYAQNPATPNAVQLSLDHPENLREGILTASKEGRKKIVIPPGVYKIPLSDTGANLEFAGLSDFEIDATGATLLFQDNTKTSIYFRNCQNVAVRGLTVRNAVIPFTQGAIESIEDDRKSFVLKIDDGYPATLDDSKFFDPRTTYYVFDRKTRHLKNDTYDYGSSGVERVDATHFRVSFGNALGKEVEVGDLTSMRGRGGTGIHSDNCTKMRFENVSVEYASGFGWFETGGDGANFYDHIAAKPGPKPEGAKAEPLMSENADAFHSAGTKVGPTIQNALFTRMPDDGIAIHGEYQMVRQQEGNVLTCMRPWGGLPYAVGDRVGLVAKNGVPGGEACVTAVKSLPDSFLPPLETEFPHFRDNRCFFQLTLDQPLAAKEGDVVSNLDHTGSGFVLRGNSIINHRARGLLLKASDGLVENNLVDGSSIAGLVIGPELWWGEGNYAHRVTIRGNTFTHCGYATTGPWSDQAGALTVLGTGDSPDARGHSDITIENNFFVANDGVNVVLDGLENSSFIGNRFLSAQKQENRRGADRSIDIGALVYINRAKNLKLSGNVTQRTGTANTTFVKATEKASDVTGQTDGIKTAPARTADIPRPINFEYADNKGAPRREVRDPCMIREGDTYYMVFTMWPFANREDGRMALPNNGSSPGIQLFSSKDLVTWNPENWLVKSSDLPANSPYKHRFWAPEIHKFGSKFYLIFTADNWSKPEYNPAGNWGAAGYAFVGVADKITGPYNHITYIPEGACDTTLAQDKNGDIYAVMPKYDIFARKIDLSQLDKGAVKWLGPEKKVLACDSRDTVLGTTPNYLEGPWVQKVGSKFVMFYAQAYSDGYWTGAAYADSPAGPWTKDARNRVFEGGHVAAFAGPDGRTWFSYRIEDNAEQRGLLSAQPLDFDGRGRVLTNGPTNAK